MKKKFLTVLLAIIAALCLCFGLAACGEDKNTDDGLGTEGLAFHMRRSATGEETMEVAGIGMAYECDIVIPATYRGLPVTSIADSAFSNCDHLTSIEIPDGVASIGEFAFQYCSGLSSIKIPDSVISIGVSAFYGTVYDNDATKWDESGVLYIGNHLIRAQTTLSGYTVRAGTKTIADSAFYEHSSLTSIVIPDSVTSIGSSAFHFCRGLTDIQFNGTVEEWQTIDKGGNGYGYYNNWDFGTGNYTVTCTNGTIKEDGTVTMN